MDQPPTRFMKLKISPFRRDFCGRGIQAIPVPKGCGLRSTLFQAKLTAIAVNLKRIAAIVGGKYPQLSRFCRFFGIWKTQN